jgi:hypothetical protein
VENIAKHIEYEYAHYFALHNNDTALIVDANSARMLQNGGAKFANELAILIAEEIALKCIKLRIRKN